MLFKYQLRIRGYSGNIGTLIAPSELRKKEPREQRA